jgi:serine/threonine-protein kinase
MLAGRRLFGGDDAGAVIAKVLLASVPPLSEHRSDVPPALEAVIRRSLTVKPAQRYATAQDFADALEEAAPKLASPRTVGAWVRARAADAASKQHQLVTRLEQGLSGEISGAVAAPSRPGSASVPEAPQPALDGALMPTPPSTPGEASRSPSEAPTRVAGWAAASQEIPVAPALPRGVGMLTPASGVGMIRTPPSGVRMPTPPSGVRMPTPPSGVGMPTPPSGVGMPTPPSAAAAPMPFSTQPVASPLGAIGSIPPPPAYDRRTVVAVIVGCVVALLGLVLILALVMSGSPEHSPPPPTSPP